MKKLFKTLAILTCLVGFHTSANAAPANSSLSSIQECTGGVHPANNSFCRSTPEKYETTIYEMGLCSSHPFDDGVVTTTTMDKSSCTVIFSNTSGDTIDIVTILGGTSTLQGTATRPADGTYKYPYMIMDTTFTVRGSTQAVGGGTTHYSGDSDTSDDTSGPAADYAYDLENLGDGSVACYSGLVDQTGTVGTIDAYLTSSALVRPESTALSSGNCPGVTRLIGVMDLTAPFTVTPNTSTVKFTFDITGYGLRSWAGNTGDVERIESGPFSGNFSVINVD